MPQPPVQSLQWITRAVGAGSSIEAVRFLSGATSSTLFSIDVRHRGRGLQLVLRLFTNKEWLLEEPDLVQHEAASLEKARTCSTTTPELIACDETGEYCGHPAILSTRLPGRVELEPVDFDHWLHQLAEALIPIHTIDAKDFPWSYSPYNDITLLEAPGWSDTPELWGKAIGIVQGPSPSTATTFIHRDYHPTNVLWQGGQVSGVVDWPNACRGPANIDVAWCRGNLASLHGVSAADCFLRAYTSLAGTAFEYHPYWDLIVLIEGLPGPPTVYQPWIDFGVRGLDVDLMRVREDEYLASIMARF